MSTLGTLKADLADWLNRSDAGTIAKIPTFIRLAETDIYKNLQIRDNEFVVTLTDSDAPINPIELPDNFRALRMVVHNNCQLAHVSDQEYTLVQTDPGVLRPQVCTTMERQLYLAPWVNSAPAEWPATTITIHYWGTESLVFMPGWNTPTNPTEAEDDTPVESTFTGYTQSDDNTTRLLQKAYDMYLYGALRHAAIYLKNREEAATFAEIFNRAKADLIRDDKRAKYSGSTSQVSAAYGT